MNKSLLIFALSITSLSVNAQTNIFPPSGNVGIGITTPTDKLVVNGTEKLYGDLVFGSDKTPYFIHPSGYGGAIRLRSNVYEAVDRDLQFGNIDNLGVWNSFMTVGQNGFVGIGTTTPDSKLVVNGTQKLFGDLIFGSEKTAYFIHPTGYGGAIRFRSNVLEAVDRDVQFGNIDNLGTWNSFMTIGQNGSVGIGTTSPDSKLAVNGIIHAREVKVDQNSWPDYVFKPAYNLLSLSEVKSYVNRNHHLPEMPSESDVAKEGINLGEMNKLLLKKVEELTLYLIQQKEEADRQKSEISELKKQMKDIGK